MKVYTTSNGIILGNKEGKKVTGIFINNANAVTEEDFSRMALAYIDDDFQTVRVGKGDSLGERFLKAEEELTANIVNLQTEAAVSQSDTWVVKRVFGELRKKY